MTKQLHLQGIRGVAICSVIAFHYFPDYFPNGYLGVDLFFVLSGYLMSIMLSRHSTLTLPIIAEFLYRRVKRIVPLYYLIVLASTTTIYLCPCSELITNMIASERAIWLSTNLYYNTGEDYFEKMGASHDLFTHTWSLCLEMQFYLIFPLIWWLQMNLTPRKRMVFLHVISCASLCFYFISDSRQAFNNMFCRIWQFLLGNMVYCLEKEDSSNNQESKYQVIFSISDSKDVLLDEEEQERRKEEVEETPDWIFASLSLVLLIYSVVTEKHLTQNYSRMTTTIVAIILVHFGKGFSALENAVMVFLGEISYAWYLVHWPMLSIQKVFEYTTTPEMVLGLILSFGVAVFVHYFLEKSYLGWDKSVITTVVAVLFFGCLSVYFSLSYFRLPGCEWTPVLRSDYSHMSIEERKLYYAGLMDHDVYQLTDERCIFDRQKKSSLFSPSKGNLEYFQGQCKYENSKASNNRTLAIVGNSWVANTAPLIFDECNKTFGNIQRISFTGNKSSEWTAFSACEVLKATATPECQAKEKAYMDFVKLLKPDYLFIIHRYYFMQFVYTDKEWEGIVKVATERLARLAGDVKEKIFILHTFPLAYLNRKMINAALDNGSPIDWANVPNLPLATDMPKTQEKLNLIISTCTKCEQFDFTPQFLVNNTFYPYDPDYLIPYVNPGLHFTQPGLQRIRPLFTDICSRIGN